jgi:hypothetical protein
MALYASTISTAQDNNMIPKQTPITGEPSQNSTIQDLAKEREELQKSVDRWNIAYIAFLGLTIVVVVGAGISQFKTITQARSLVAVQSKIEREKDRQSSKELGELNASSAKINERAGKLEVQAESLKADAEKSRAAIASAQVEVASATERAAEANRKAEEEKRARLELEKGILPRTLRDQQGIANRLRPFTGTSVIVETIIDFEARRTAALIASTLTMAGWKVSGIIISADAPIEEWFFPGVAIEVSGNASNLPSIGTVPMEEFNRAFETMQSRYRAAQSLITELKNSGVEASLRASLKQDLPPDTLRVRVGLKRMPGEPGSNLVITGPPAGR